MLPPIHSPPTSSFPSIKSDEALPLYRPENALSEILWSSGAGKWSPNCRHSFCFFYCCFCKGSFYSLPQAKGLKFKLPPSWCGCRINDSKERPKLAELKKEECFCPTTAKVWQEPWCYKIVLFSLSASNIIDSGLHNIQRTNCLNAQKKKSEIQAGIRDRRRFTLLVDVLLLLSHWVLCFVNVPCVITAVFLPSVVQNSVGGVWAHRLCVIGPAGIAVGPPRAGSPH